ncbi:hypothetical protein F2Q68_00040389 [Brassica cretica]|uniref:Uncharacterized protein n=1 Tax=Brassica cretica TaxID=69181 RepID=A0A8S9MAP2_BRACR|nr:hypothetical protein F2Q68_00040389 [Brassica cretica]
MMTTLIDEIRSQRITNQALANRLDQAEKELAEYRAANVRERNRTPLDPLRTTSNVQSTGLFDTLEIPSARSGRYTGENSQRPPPQGIAHRSLSYSGLDEIESELQRPQSTPIQFHNGSIERQGEPGTRISPPNHSTPENRTPSATRTFHQAGLENLAEKTRRHDPCGPINIDPQREGGASDPEIHPKNQSPNEQKRKRDRAGVTELPTPGSEEKCRHDFMGAEQQNNRRNQEPNRGKI